MTAATTARRSQVAAQTSGFDALLMPAVAITPPPIAAFEQDGEYRRPNALLLRNTSVIRNFLDRCAITVPIRTVGPSLGLIIVGGLCGASSPPRCRAWHRGGAQQNALSAARAGLGFFLFGRATPGSHR